MRKMNNNIKIIKTSHDDQAFYQRGFSLLEVLVASSLSLFIVLGMVSLYASNKDSYRLQEAMSHLQRNSNFAAERLSRTIQSAGYSGFYASFSEGVETRINTPTDDRWNITKPLAGFDNVTSTTSYAGITNMVVGTDVILLKGMTDISHPSIDSVATSMTLAADDGYVAGDVLIATDQTQASIFQINNANNAVAGETTVTVFNGTSPAPGNNGLLTNIYGIDAEIGKLASTMYYLKIGENGRNALFEAQLKTSASQAPNMIEKEMIADVEDLQLTYGVDTDDNGSVDRFDSATTVEMNNHWQQVRIVGISLLLASDQSKLTIEKNSYTFSPTRFTYVKDAIASAQADRRLRRAFTTYIAVRNG